MVQAKRGNRSAKSKKLRRKRYRQKKKSIWQHKYYDKLSEDSLKKSYSSIPIEERLPIGILESNNDETEELSSSGKEKVSHIQCTTCIDNPNEPIEYIYGIEGNVYKYLCSFLCNRSQRVVLNSASSLPLDLSERWCTTWFSFRKYSIILYIRMYLIMLLVELNCLLMS